MVEAVHFFWGTLKFRKQGIKRLQRSFVMHSIFYCNTVKFVCGNCVRLLSSYSNESCIVNIVDNGKMTL
jgi:hypothetical protein